MNTNYRPPEASVDDDALWLNQKARDIEASDLAVFRHTMNKTLDQGWELMDARHYADGRMLGSKLWAPQYS